MRISTRISGLYNNQYMKKIKKFRFPMAENTSKVFFNQNVNKQSLTFIGADCSGFGNLDQHYADFSDYPIWFQVHYTADNPRFLEKINFDFTLMDITATNKERIKASRPTPLHLLPDFEGVNYEPFEEVQTPEM